MSKFIKRLVDENLIQDWADTIDWLLSNDRFTEEKGWDKNKKNKFTRTAKKMMSLPKDNYIHESLKNISFSDIMKRSKKTKTCYIVMAGSGPFCTDLVRHIRNGIAHGHTEIRKAGSKLYIEILDYSDNTQKTQTAYIFLPLTCIPDLQKIYVTIESQSWQKESAHKKKTA